MALDAGSSLDRDLSTLLDTCERRIGYCFRDKGLLRSALTHASGAEHRLASNERLEFLGDAILGAVVCEQLYRQYPDFLEGDLTKLKSIVVSRQTCARISEALGMQEFLILGKGMTTSPSVPPSLLADVFESLIAGYLPRRRGRCGAGVHLRGTSVPRSTWRQAASWAATTSRCSSSWRSGSTAPRPATSCSTRRGPTIASVSRSAAQIGSNRFQAAWGRNKKEAEQRAARNALSELNHEAPPFPSD